MEKLYCGKEKQGVSEFIRYLDVSTSPVGTPTNLSERQ
jgi:hypothetical protein